MKKYLKRSLLFLLALSMACNTDKQIEKNENVKEMKNFKILNTSEIKIVTADNIYYGEETCTKLFFSNGSYKLCNAYINCNKDSVESINISNKEIIGCQQKLYIDKDTVQICLTPSKVGKSDFQNITLLFSDKENVYYITDTSFSLNVKEKR